jgi:hypothetical protein
MFYDQSVAKPEYRWNLNMKSGEILHKNTITAIVNIMFNMQREGSSGNKLTLNGYVRTRQVRQ